MVDRHGRRTLLPVQLEITWFGHVLPNVELPFQAPPPRQVRQGNDGCRILPSGQTVKRVGRGQLKPEPKGQARVLPGGGSPCHEIDGSCPEA